MAAALAKYWCLSPNPEGVTKHGTVPAEQNGHQVLRSDFPKPCHHPLGHSYTWFVSAESAGEAPRVEILTLKLRIQRNAVAIRPD